MLHTFTSFLTESLNARQFYVSVDANRKGVMDALCRGELDGIKGISGTADNINQFFASGGGILLAMPRVETLALNELEKVEYGNLDYLCRANLAALTRICGTHKIESTVRFVLTWIPTERRTPEVTRLIEHEIHQSLGIKKVLEMGGIHSFDELVEGLSDFYNLSDVPDFADVLHQTILASTADYREEQEWLVQGTLHLPTTTKLYVPNLNVPGVDELRRHYRVRVLGVQTQRRIKSWVKKY